MDINWSHSLEKSQFISSLKSPILLMKVDNRSNLGAIQKSILSQMLEFDRMEEGFESTEMSVSCPWTSVYFSVAKFFRKIHGKPSSHDMDTLLCP